MSADERNAYKRGFEACLAIVRPEVDGLREQLAEAKHTPTESVIGARLSVIHAQQAEIARQQARIAEIEHALELAVGSEP